MAMRFELAIGRQAKCNTLAERSYFKLLEYLKL